MLGHPTGDSLTRFFCGRLDDLLRTDTRDIARPQRPSITRPEVAEMCAAEALTSEGGRLVWRPSRRASESPVGRRVPRHQRAAFSTAHQLAAAAAARGGLAMQADRVHVRVVARFQGVDAPLEHAELVGVPQLRDPLIFQQTLVGSGSLPAG